MIFSPPKKEENAPNARTHAGLRSLREATGVHDRKIARHGRSHWDALDRGRSDRRVGLGNKPPADLRSERHVLGPFPGEGRERLLAGSLLAGCRQTEGQSRIRLQFLTRTTPQMTTSCHF